MKMLTSLHSSQTSWSKMLQNMSTINTNTIHIFELLNFIIDELPLQKHVQNIVNNVFKTLSESRMLGSGEKRHSGAKKKNTESICIVV